MSASYRRLIECMQPCTQHLTFSLYMSGFHFHKVRSIRWYGSGILQTKPHWANSKMDRQQWKGKKSKSSSEKKLHHELLKVLNKRAAQLILNRETHQLHRVLVTNFSFMDFPVQMPHDDVPRFKSDSVPVLNRTDHGLHGSISDLLSDRDWLQQFTDFHLQMEAVAHRARHETVNKLDADIVSTDDLEMKVLNYFSSSKPSELPKPLSKVEQDSVVSTYHKELKSAQKKKYKNKVKAGASTIKRHDTVKEKFSPLSSQQQRSVSANKISEVPSIVKQPVVVLEALAEETSFSEDLVIGGEDCVVEDMTIEDEEITNVYSRGSKLKQSKANDNTLRNYSVDVAKHHEEPLAEGTSFGEDLVMGEADGAVEDMATEGELWLSEVDLKRIDAVTNVYAKDSELKLSKANNNTMRNYEDIAKHHDEAKLIHVFNQDLLPFIESCCFAGLESVAYNLLNVIHYGQTNTDELTGKLRIQNIAVYNCLMHAWAKKGQLSRIKELFTFMKKNGIHPNMQSYAACLECIGRRVDIDVALGNRILEDMKKEGLDLRELFNVCIFRKDERKVIHKVILSLDPDYVTYPVSDPFPPSGPLLDGLDTSWPKDKVVEKNPYAGVLPLDQLHQQAETQLQREIHGSLTVSSILKQSSPNSRTQDCRNKLEGLKEEWRELLKAAFEKKVRMFAGKQKMAYGATLYPYLKLFPSQDYAQCILQEIDEMGLSSESFSPRKSLLWLRLGNRVFNKYILMDKVQSEVAKKVSALYKTYLNDYNNPDLDLDSHRQRWQTIMNRMADGPSLNVPEKVWPNHVLLGIGKLLYDLILNDLKINTNILKDPKSGREMVHAFYTIMRTRMKHTAVEIKVHPSLLKLYKLAEIDKLTFDTTFLPMLVPPVPWISTGHGGYLLNAVRLIRLPPEAQMQMDKVQEKTTDSKIASVLDAINTLSACAWKINKQVLDIVIEIFNKKGDSSLDIPPPASECPPAPKITQSMSAQEKANIRVQHRKIRMQKADMHSLWSHELYRLSIANKFRDDVFWFPHNLDFRGRTYPCPPHFNHLGNDIVRSILLFAKGKPLGPCGLDWMKIHLVNLTGFKKRCSNKDRLAYANDIMPEILDSADRPLTGNKWWQKSDKPWQTLACCMEIAKAVRSQHPEDYVCHLPIHQDGSCNGLQHYAALGRDQDGAQSVNLWPYELPQDVYSDVCELIEKERAKDAAEGVKIAQVMEGFVSRKVIKQTVMTTVYGVTRYGAKYQILKQLKDIPEFPAEHAWAGSRYLTEKTFQSLHQMFSATKDIQNWLTLSAQLIASVCHQPVEWVTPLGLPVTQPYHRTQHMNRFSVVSSNTMNYFEKPNVMKQKNAFPPNFIHSLDSTHMMLTALYCLRAGITFVSVHDCFWTHACDVTIMNKICREQFVALHKQPVLEDLSQQFINRYTPVQGDEDNPVTKEKDFLFSVLSNVPSRGTFDLDKVLESTYFFS